MNLSSRSRRSVLLLTLVLTVLAALPAAASAQLQTIDFEDGPALGTPVETVGQVTFSHTQGFRPYRTEVGARAHSGSVVGDIGRCTEETGGGGGCEFFHAFATGQLARTADRVTLFAGMFNGQNPPEEATLTALRADGSVVATAGPSAVDANGFDRELSVSSAGGEIASFVVEASGGDLGIDDVKVSFADGAKPDFSVATTGEVIPLVQGQQATVPVSVSRVNGSAGPIQISVAGLPAGVSASVSPNPIPATQTTATVTLSAASNAPDTHFKATEATVTADPLGDPDVAPGPRATGLSVRVATDFELSLDGFTSSEPPEGGVVVPLPDCTPIEAPAKISRDIGLNQDIALSLRGVDPGHTSLPPGFGAEIRPSATVSPGGGLVAERGLRFESNAGSSFGENGFRTVVLDGTLGGSTHSLPLRIIRAAPRATIASSTPGSGLGDTPRFGKPGTTVRVHGSGFCPGTHVLVGNKEASTPATLVDNHTLEFTVPRYATTGPVTIVPPGSNLSSYQTEDSLTVNSVRNHDGFSFINPAFGSLSLPEFIRAFGVEEVFISVNPCWPWGDCRVSTGIPDPVAAAELYAFNSTLPLIGRRPSAHCFGMALAIQEFKEGKQSYGEFHSSGPQPAQSAYELDGPAHPSAKLESFLDVDHVKQFSSEFSAAAGKRHPQLLDELAVLEKEFAHNREPMVSMYHHGEGHTLLAYDLEQTPTEAKIYGYDPNRPVAFNEEGSEYAHHNLVDESVIHIDKVHHRWSFLIGAGEDWEGGDDGVLWVVPHGTVPANPSLPELGALATMIFDSNGSVRSSAGAGAKLLPTAEPRPGAPAPTPFSEGSWVASRPGQPLDVKFHGVKDGSYSQAYSAHGFVASVNGVSTSKGVDDSIEGSGDTLRFASGSDRPLRVRVAKTQSPTLSLAATLATHASAGGADTTAIAPDGALTYAHDGAATTASFTLTSVSRDGGPSTFVSGPVAIHRGDHLRAQPVGPGLKRVRLTIRGAGGKLSTRVIGNRARSHRRLRVAKPAASGHRVAVGVRLSGSRGRAVFGVALRLMRGHHVVARFAKAVQSSDGHGHVAWNLPRSVKPGSYRLVTLARGIVGGGRGSSVSGAVVGRGSAAVRVRR